VAQQGIGAKGCQRHQHWRGVEHTAVDHTQQLAAGERGGGCGGMGWGGAETGHTAAGRVKSHARVCHMCFTDV
jgi:hypothetical protein